MKFGELFASLTLNVALAVFSMLMAVVALGLLAFVLAKDNYQRSTGRIHPKEKLRRHESTIIDFKNPSTVPDHFLQLNTLMFQKKPKNNQIKQMEPMELPGLVRMSSVSESEEAFASRSLPPIPMDDDRLSAIVEVDVASNQVSPVKREKRQDNDIGGSSSPTSFVTDSGISEDDSDTSSLNSNTPSQMVIL